MITRKQDKIRVAHVVRALDVGGLENVAAGLINGLTKRGVATFLACLLHPGTRAESVRTRSVWQGHLKNTGSLSCLLSLRRWMRKEGITLIHSHNPQPHLFAVAVSMVTGIPVVHTKHGRNYPDNPRRVWLNRQLARCTKKIIAVSDDAAEVALNIEKIPAGKVRVIRNGIDMQYFVPVGTGAAQDRAEYVAARAQIRRALGLSPDAFLIGSVGRFSTEKDYPLLLRAFAEFRQRLSTFNVPPSTSSCLLLVGDGPERKALETLTDALELRDAVIMPGMQGDVRPWLQAMDVFCLSSKTEGTSVTLVEAAACGVPAVVTDVGGNREIVANGTGGIVVSNRKEEDLIAAFERLYQDEGLRLRMGRAARHHVEKRYSLDAMVESYLKVYREILGRKDENFSQSHGVAENNLHRRQHLSA